MRTMLVWLAGLGLAAVFIVSVVPVSATEIRGINYFPGSYFLEPIADDPEGWPSYWHATGTPLDYQKLIWPGKGIDSSESPYVDNPIATGWYNVHVKMAAQNATYPTPDGWYKLQLWMLINGGSGGNTTTMKGTFSYQYESATTYYCSQWGYLPESYIYPKGRGGQYYYAEFTTNPATGLPFRASDLSDGWDFGFEFKVTATSSTPIHLGPAWGVLKAVPGPALSGNGVQILRPNADLEVPPDWSIIGATTANDALNETTLYSDNDTTYISSSLSGFPVSLLFDDPSTDLDTDHSFSISIWVYAKSSEDYSQDRQLLVSVATGYSSTVDFFQWITTAYHNWSFSCPNSPATGRPWTWNELVDLKMWISGSANQSVTQVAVIVYDANYVPPGSEQGGAWDVISWVSAGGLMTLFGILGFVGMVSTPTLTYLQYRSGEEASLSAAHFVWLMGFFGGLFIIALRFGG